MTPNHARQPSRPVTFTGGAAQLSRVSRRCCSSTTPVAGFYLLLGVGLAGGALVFLDRLGAALDG